MHTETRQVSIMFKQASKATKRFLQNALMVAATALVVSNTAYAWQPGKDGAGNITAANTVINTYYTVSGSPAAGATTLTLSSTTGLTQGDILMIYQAQGATIDTTDTAAYGSVTNLNSAGRYEFVSVLSVAGTTVTIAAPCSAGLRSAYPAAGRPQAVRVPQYTTLTISGAGSVVATAWNGASGGIVAAFVNGAATLGGAGINVTGQGFRGGRLLEQDTSPADATSVTSFRSAVTNDGSEKGESIAGFFTEYDALNGRYGRGAPANGGGGGNGHNSGGGGGSNGNNGVAYTGTGNPNAAAQGTSTAAQTAAAWNLEGAGFATSTSSGGGRGGYTYSGANQDATTRAPGATQWTGDNRDNVGGRGGRPLTNNPNTGAGVNDGRLFFGGGGGAGDSNNGTGTAGANGGGLVFIRAANVSGAIVASGANAATATAIGVSADAPGGGGGGGSIVVIGTNTATLTASGGIGGTQNVNNGNEAEGPGGGGGGGFISAAGGTQSVAGGVNGTTNSAAVTEFIHNGATRGAAGNTTGAPTAAAICPLSLVTLRKTWANATVNDTATVTGTATGGTTTANLTSLNAVANSAAETDTGALQSAAIGSQITLAETFGAGNGSAYTQVLACTGNTTALAGAVLTVNAADTNIVCTFTNTGSSAGAPIATPGTCPADFFQTRQGVDGGGAQQTAVLRFPASVLTGGGAATNLYSPATTLITTGVNGVGYRRQDGYIYGLNTGTTGPTRAQLVRVGLGGPLVVGDILNGGSQITPFTPTGGTFDQAGRYYFAGQGGGNIDPPSIFRVDTFPATTGTVNVAQAYALSPATLINIGDFAFGPDGRLYGATGTTLVQITLTGATATVVQATLPSSVGGIGSAFMNDGGQFFVYDNGTQQLRRVTFTYGAGFPGTMTVGAPVTITPPATPTNGQSSDGASCVTFDINVTAAKTDGPTNTTYAPGATDTYTITVTNSGTSPAFGVQVLDNLPNGLTLTGPWSCVASGTGACSAASGGVAGGNVVSLTVDLAPGGTATITVPVTYSSNPANY